MTNHETQHAEQESAKHVRKPVDAEIHAQKSPRERQQDHHPAVLRGAEEHRRGNSQVVHRMAGREAVLVERRNSGLDRRIGIERAGALHAKFYHPVCDEAYRESRKRMPQNREKIVPAHLPEKEQREEDPDVAVAQAHVKT